MLTKSVISEQEKAHRQYAIDSALGSLRLEGLEPSSEVLGIAEQFKQGEISLDEMSRMIHALLHRRPVHISS